MSTGAIISLPQRVEEQISKILAEAGTKEWINHALTLSTRYRQERSEKEPLTNNTFVKTRDDVLGYLALRVPATYAQLFGALSSIKELNPFWTPKSVLDLGSGPGTAIWAAKGIWQSVSRVSLVECDSNFIEIGRDILNQFLTDNTIAEWERVDLVTTQPKVDSLYDLVVLGNILNELSSEQRERILDFAYNHCSGVLLIVESGTPFGSKIISQALQYLYKREGYIAAPFIDSNIDNIGAEWISFSQKIKRPEFQRLIRKVGREQLSKQKLLPPSDWEEERYSYLAFSKFKSELIPWARVIGKPKLSKSDLELRLLTSQGMEIKRIPKRDKIHYKNAKHLKWGDILLSPEYIL